MSGDLTDSCSKVCKKGYKYVGEDCKVAGNSGGDGGRGGNGGKAGAPGTVTFSAALKKIQQFTAVLGTNGKPGNGGLGKPGFL